MENGIEIIMFDVGDADCILVTRWLDFVPIRVLIDGGKSSEKVVNYLMDNDIDTIEHIVCTHPDDDHSAGLLELVSNPDIEIKHAWMHLPQNHVNTKNVRNTLTKLAKLDEAKIILASLDTADSLYDAIIVRDIPIDEPFEGMNIGFLKVCGPSESYYEKLLAKFRDIDNARALFEDQLMEKIASLSSTKLLDDPKDTPENQSSVILLAKIDGLHYLFTGDAGVEALERADDFRDLQNCHWIKVPHHGSINNINDTIIDHINPTLAYISAGGAKGHPHEAVISALEAHGTKVFSTHISGDLLLQE